MSLSIAIILLFPILGSLIDQLLLKREKPIVYDRLTSLGETINNTSFPKIHQIAIKRVIGFLSPFFQFSRKPWRAIILTIAVSWGLTSMISFISRFNPACNTCPEEIQVWHDYLPWYPIYLVNIFFDFLTIGISLGILRYMRKKNWFSSILLLIADIGIAFVFGALCFTSMTLFSVVAEEHLNIGQEWKKGSEYYSPNKAVSFESFIEENISNLSAEEIYDLGFTNEVVAKIRYKPMDHFRQMIEYPVAVIKLLQGEPHEYDAIGELVLVENGKREIIQLENTDGLFSSDLAFLSLTTFLPTLTFCFFLLVAILSKEVFIISKRISARLIQSSLDKVEGKNYSGFKPGSHFGIVFSLIGGILKIFHELIKIL